MDTDVIDLLREEVEKTFGRKVLSSADCQQLCMDLHQKTILRISFNTLRRFFNLIKDNHAVSNYTCEVLVQYCGFATFQDFINYKKEKATDKVDKKVSNLLDFIVRVFKNIEVSNKHDITYFSLVKQTISYLDRHPSIVDRFQREISRTKNGQDFYYEQFINIDKLNHYYGDGLRYYLCEKKTKEAQLLGHSLLCFRSWMMNDNKDVKQHLDVIMSYTIDHSMRPSVCARYFATQLYYSNSLGLQIEPILIKARQFFLFLSPTNYTYSSYYCFEIIMSEALILTGFYEEALFYLDEILERIKLNIPSYIDVALLQTICLFKSIVFVNIGKKNNSREIFDSINPNKFYFLSKKYLTILYFSLSKNFRRKQFEYQQVTELIKDTGFERLMTYWSSPDPLTISHSLSRDN